MLRVRMAPNTHRELRPLEWAHRWTRPKKKRTPKRCPPNLFLELFRLNGPEETHWFQEQETGSLGHAGKPVDFAGSEIEHRLSVNQLRYPIRC